MSGEQDSSSNAGVLVVDDDLAVRDMFYVTLADAGFDVRCAETGRGGIAAAEEQPPEVAVIDLILEDIPGIAVMKDLRRIDPYVECVVVTGQAPEHSAVAAAQLGAFTYLMKPCQQTQLVLAVSRAAERSAMRRTIDLHDATLSAVLGAGMQTAFVLDRAGRVLKESPGTVSSLAGPDDAPPSERVLYDLKGCPACLQKQVETVLSTSRPASVDVTWHDKRYAAGLFPIGLPGEAPERVLLVCRPPEAG